MTLSGATTPGQSEPGSDGTKGVLRISHISKAGASLSDGLISYPRHSWEDSYPSDEKQSVYSPAPTDKAIKQIYLKIICIG